MAKDPAVPCVVLQDIFASGLVADAQSRRRRRPWEKKPVKMVPKPVATSKPADTRKSATTSREKGTGSAAPLVAAPTAPNTRDQVTHRVKGTPAAGQYAVVVAKVADTGKSAPVLDNRSRSKTPHAVAVQTRPHTGNGATPKPKLQSPAPTAVVAASAMASVEAAVMAVSLSGSPPLGELLESVDTTIRDLAGPSEFTKKPSPPVVQLEEPMEITVEVDPAQAP